MSVEAIQTSDSAEVIALFSTGEGVEAPQDPCEQYTRAFNYLGLVAIRLDEVNKEYQAAIQAMIACRTALEAEGVDVNALAARLHSDCSSTSAINNYGHGA